MPTRDVGAACANAVGDACTAFNEPIWLASLPCDDLLWLAAVAAADPRWLWLVPALTPADVAEP